MTAATDAVAEDLLRARLLNASGRKSACAVAKLLRVAVSNKHVPSTAASKQAWLITNHAIASKVVTALTTNKPLWLVTILFGTPDLAVADIADIDLKSLHQRLRMLFRRHGLGDRVVFGVFEFDYLEWRNVFLTTVHMIVPATTKAEFEALRKAIKKVTPRWLKRPLQAKKVTDLPGLIGYFMKGCIVAKRRYREKKKKTTRGDRPGTNFKRKSTDKKGRKRTRKIRLIGRLGRDALLWQHQYTPRDFLFLQRLRL